MKFLKVGVTMACTLILCGTQVGLSQSTEQTQGEAVRVTVSMHPDGSRRVYKFDNAQHKAVATTTDPDGELRETIRHGLGEAGRFSSAESSGPDGRSRLETRYNYGDGRRRLVELRDSEYGRRSRELRHG